MSGKKSMKEGRVLNDCSQMNDLVLCQGVMTFLNEVVNMKTVGKVILMMALSVSALSAVAKERICFTRQLTEGMIGTFSCHFYSPRKTGAMKMVWYPRASCLVSQGQKSKSCKVWSVMQLSRIELSTFAPAWHYSGRCRGR